MCCSKPRLHVSAFLAVLLCLVGGRAFAQIDRGTIQGLVTDGSGAVVPSPRVEMVHIETNGAVTISTNDEGLVHRAEPAARRIPRARRARTDSRRP